MAKKQNAAVKAQSNLIASSVIPEREHTEGILSTGGAANDEEIKVIREEAPLDTANQAENKDSHHQAPLKTAINPKPNEPVVHHDQEKIQEKRSPPRPNRIFPSQERY